MIAQMMRCSDPLIPPRISSWQMMNGPTSVSIAYAFNMSLGYLLSFSNMLKMPATSWPSLYLMSLCSNQPTPAVAALSSSSSQWGSAFLTHRVEGNMAGMASVVDGAPQEVRSAYAAGDLTSVEQAAALEVQTLITLNPMSPY